MNNRAAALAVCVVAVTVASVTTGCAEDAAGKKLSFTPKDYKVEFLEPDKIDAALKPTVTEKVKNIVDFTDQKLEPALAAVPAPAPQVIKFAMTKAKPIITSKVSESIMAEVDSHHDEVKAVVTKYNVLKDPELQYELIDVEGKTDAKPLLVRVNESLTRAYKTIRSVRVAHKMLDVAKKDAAAVKAKPDPATLAGVGIGALAITDLTLTAIDDAKTIGPDLQSMSTQVANELQAHPMWALDLGPAASKLTGASTDITTLPADAGSVLGDVVDLFGLFTN